MTFLFVSCVDELDSPKIPTQEDQQIEKIKSWFEENEKYLRLPESKPNLRKEKKELILPFFEKKPNWKKFHHYYFRDGREVYEVNLTSNLTYLPTFKTDIDPNEASSRVIQNILFVKNPSEDRFDPLIVRYYPNDVVSKRDFKDINYQMIDEKWSGTVDIFTYDEHHFIGFDIEKGQILGTRMLEKVPNGERKTTLQNENKDYKCFTKIIDWYQISYVEATGTWNIQQLDSTSSTSCSGQSGADQPSTPESNYIYQNDNYFSGNGGTGYYPPNLPPPTLTIYIDSTIRDNPRMSCILDKLSLSGFVKSIADFTNTESTNRTSLIRLNSLSPGVNGQTTSTGEFHDIVINSNKLDRPDLMIAKTILHELVHAEINSALRSQGQTVLDNNFAGNFDKFINFFYPSENTNFTNELHHKYMAENLLSTMGLALMDIHKNYFPDDYQKLNNYLKSSGISPKGVSSDFYINICWEGLKGTFAYAQMAAITTNPPLLSQKQIIDRDILSASYLTKPCGQ